MKSFQNLTQPSSSSNPNYWYCSKICLHPSCNQQKMAFGGLRYIHHRVLYYCHGNGTEWYWWLQTNIISWMHISSTTKYLPLQKAEAIHSINHGNQNWHSRWNLKRNGNKNPRKTHKPRPQESQERNHFDPREHSNHIRRRKPRPRWSNNGPHGLQHNDRQHCFC